MNWIKINNLIKLFKFHQSIKRDNIKSLFNDQIKLITVAD